MEELKIQFKEMRQSLKMYMTELMNERGVGGSELHTDSILPAIQRSTTEMNSALGQIHLAAAINDNMEDEEVPHLLFDEEVDFNGNEESENVGTEFVISEVEEIRRKERIKSARKKLENRRLTMGYHNGRLQVLPVYWEFPKMTMKQLIDNWFVGNEKDKIPPLALLEDDHVKHIGTYKSKHAGRVKLRQMRSVMKVVKFHAIEEDCWLEDKGEWTVEYVRKLWVKIGEKHIYAKYASKTNRKKEVSWKTVFNMMVKQKAFQQIN